MTGPAGADSPAERAARRWARHSDAEDLLAECRIVEWQHRDEPAGVILWRCRNRIIDVLRSTRGDSRTNPPTVVPLEDHHVPGAEDPDLAPSVSWGLPGRLGVVADLLAAGERPCDIAAGPLGGLHPSRVSQLKAEIRRRIT